MAGHGTSLACYEKENGLDVGALPPNSLFKNSNRNQLWEFIIGHVMKTILLILHPTALR